MLQRAGPRDGLVSDTGGLVSYSRGFVRDVHSPVLLRTAFYDRLVLRTAFYEGLVSESQGLVRAICTRLCCSALPSKKF